MILSDITAKFTVYGHTGILVKQSMESGLLLYDVYIKFSTNTRGKS